MTDAGTGDGAPDARPDARPDAPNTVTLTVRVDGRGVVSIPTVGECDAGSGQAVCPFEVAKNIPLTLNALPKNHWRFAAWTDACSDALSSTCVLTPTANVLARVRFEMEDD